jgi:uncharacterized protein (TIGR04141 family)
MPGPKSRHLTVFLLKPDVRRDNDAIRREPGLACHPIRTGSRVQGAFYVRASNAKPPRWLDFVEPHIMGLTETLETASASGVLLVRQGDRRFAFTFGPAGRHYLRQETIESDFGLKVTLNSVDPNHLRSIDVQTVQELTVHSRHQVSRASAFDTFGLDVTRDLLRAVTGEPRDRALGDRLTGADALAVIGKVEFSDLPVKCAAFKTAYEQTTYRENFSFVDELRIVREQPTLAFLNEAVAGKLRERNIGQMHLAPAEPIEWDEVAAFRFSSNTENELSDMDLEAYLATVDGELNWARLKCDRVEVRRGDQDTFFAKWSVASCLVAEVEWDGVQYVLSGGKWFKVARELAERVASQLDQIPLAGCVLPGARPRDGEDRYNERVGDERGDLVVMHRQIIPCAERGARFELCDFFTCNRELIHVKPLTKSATLSHLFAQGIISAEALRWDRQFRATARQKMVELGKPNLANLIPEDVLNPTEYEVVYAIIARQGMDVRRGLPFFSRLHLTKAAETLRRDGYRVAVKHIVKA